jgi:hypothetical protein
MGRNTAAGPRLNTTDSACYRRESGPRNRGWSVFQRSEVHRNTLSSASISLRQIRTLQICGASSFRSASTSRTQTSTESLCTSRPSQQAIRISILSSFGFLRGGHRLQHSVCSSCYLAVQQFRVRDDVPARLQSGLASRATEKRLPSTQYAATIFILSGCGCASCWTAKRLRPSLRTNLGFILHHAFRCDQALMFSRPSTCVNSSSSHHGVTGSSALVVG